MKVYTTDKISLGGHSLDVAWVEGLSSTNVNLGVTAHGWGNHADAGYLTTYTNTDTNTQLSDAQIAAMGYIKTYTDTNTQLSDAQVGEMGYIKTYIDTNTHRGIDDTPVNGATAVSISSNWAFDNVKTAVPAGALFTDTNTTYDLSGYLTTSGKAADSNLLDGLDLHTGRNNEANKVVRTNSSGYADFGWINTTSGVATGTPTRIYCSQDSYLRYYTPASLAPYILNQGSTKNSHTHDYLGSTAKAADSELLDGLNSTAYMRDDGWNTNPGQDADTQTGMRSDFSYGNNAPNVGELLRFGAGGYSTQFSSQYAGVGKGLNFRTRNGDTASWNPWYGIWHTGNLTNNNQLTNGSNYVSYISTDQIGASLFYDINDTNYFLDLDATSRLNILQTVSTGVNKNSSQTTKDGLSLYGAHAGGEPTYGMMFTGTADSGTHGAVTSDWATYFTMNNTSSRGWIFRRVGSGNSASISAGGAATFDSYVRSDKFYDINNTSSWLDIRDTSGNYHLKANEGGMYFDAPVYYIRDLSNNAQKITIDAGTATATGSLRAPIFYDSNDTSYFTNPAGTSNLLQLTVPGSSNGWSAQLGTASISRVHNDSARASLVINSVNYPHLYINATGGTSNSNHGGVISMTGNTSSGYRRWSMGWPNYNPTVFSMGAYDDTANPHFGCGGGLGVTSWGSRFWFDTSGNGQAHASWRAPIFYDSDNTGYYLNPAGSSNLNTVAIAGTTTLSGRLNLDLATDYDSTVVTSLTQAPLQIADVNIGTTDAYLPLAHMSARYTSGYRTHMNIGLRKTASAWGDTTTGMYVALGGSDNYPTRNWLFSYGGYIRSGVDGVHATDSFRAPVFYDSNNTAYVVNPASTSTFANINAANFFGTLIGTATNADLLDNIDSSSFLRSDATDYQNNTIYQRGYLVNETSYRDRGVYGDYNSTKTNHIWSMGTAYKNHASGTNFGNLYGLAYKHTNNTTGGNMAGGHQMVWCSNGTGKSAMGDNIWTSGNVKAPIFYDSNDTNFYLNPASTSNLNVLNVNTIYSTPIAYSSNQDAYALKMGAYNNTAFDQGIKIKSTSTGQSYMSFNDRSEDALVLRGAKVGIGTNNPGAQLELYGGTPRIRLKNSNTGVSQGSALGGIDFYTSDASSEGNAINAKIEAYAHDIYGRLGLKFFTGGNGSPIQSLLINAYGDVVATGDVTATNFILSSDKRLKKNVEEVNNNHIDVNWKTFEMNSDKGQRRYGAIAQELEEVHPEFVRTDDEGMKSVAYIDLLIAKIAELEARLEKLEK